MKIKRGGLYIADLNPTVGTEAGKLRPVVVIQSDLLNEVEHPSTWIVPCTTRTTPPNILRAHLPKASAGNDQDCDAMVDQSRAIDNRRFRKYVGDVPAPLFNEIVEKLRHVGGL